MRLRGSGNPPFLADNEVWSKVSSLITLFIYRDGLIFADYPCMERKFKMLIKREKFILVMHLSFVLRIRQHKENKSSGLDSLIAGAILQTPVLRSFIKS